MLGTDYRSTFQIQVRCGLARSKKERSKVPEIWLLFRTPLLWKIPVGA